MRLLALAVILALAVLIPFAIWGASFDAWLDGEAAVRWVESWGPWGGLAVVALLIGDLVLPIPATAVMAAAGYVYGMWWGGCLNVVGSMAAGLAGYGLCRSLGSRAAAWLVDARELEKQRGLFAAMGPWLVAGSRWLPVFPEVVACLAGLTGMPLLRFTVALACGSAPLGFVYAAIGATGRTSFGLTLLLVAALPLVLWLLVRRRIASGD